MLRARAAGAGGARVFGLVPRSDAELVARARVHGADPRRRAALLELIRPHFRPGSVPAASLRSLERLADPSTCIVLAGQQPALAGGPLYLFAKAASAAQLAGRLAALGVPAVPLFWVADDDHDVSELRPGAVPRSSGEPWQADVPFAAGRIPIAKLRDPDRFATLREDLARALAHESAHRHALELLDASADPAPSVWFRRFLVAAFPESGILPVTPSMLRPGMRDLLLAEILSPGRLAEEVKAAVERLAALDLPRPIPESAPLPLFFIGEDGGRHRLLPEGVGVRVQNAARTLIDTGELRMLLDRDPERFSPDALLRPLIQDALLEPFAVVLGPTELAYHLELHEAYATRTIGRPLWIPRLRVGLLDEARVADLEREAPRWRDLVPEHHPSHWVESPLARQLVRELAERSEPWRAWLAALETNERTSPALGKRIARLARRWDDDIEKLGEAIEREVDADVAPARRTLARAQRDLWPGGEPAERVWSVLWAIARYGGGILERLSEAFDPYDERMRVLEAEPA